MVESAIALMIVPFKHYLDPLAIQLPFISKIWVAPLCCTEIMYSDWPLDLQNPVLNYSIPT